MKEYIAIYTPWGENTGFVQQRNDYMAPGAAYRVINVFCRDPKGRFLMTKRSGTKAFYPHCWEVTGGCAMAGESSRTAAGRELLEETGLRPKKWRYLGRKRSPAGDTGSFFLDDVYLAFTNRECPDIIMQEGEVEEYRWVTFEELRRIIEQEPMEVLVPRAFYAFQKLLMS